MKFNYKLTARHQFCMGDALGQFETVLISIDGNEFSNLNMVVYNEKREVQFKEKTEQENQNLIHYAFTTLEEGNIQICIFNENQNDVKFSVNYRTGVEAKDFSQLIKNNELTLAQTLVKKIESIIKSIQMEKKFLIDKQSTRIFAIEDISTKIVGYSVITLGLITLLTVIQINYLKNFFRARKMI